MASKREYRSRIAIDGLDRTPHRAFLRACGLDDDDLHKPLIGIVSTQGENTPCSMSLAPQADAARIGVAAGGGVPVPFTTISVSDGVSMNHKGMRLSLVSREIVADSIEAVMRAHAYDALVGFAGCDKTLPGIMMAMVRLNAPSVFVYGGAMLPGRWRGRDATVLTAYESVGQVQPVADHGGGSHLRHLRCSGHRNGGTVDDPPDGAGVLPAHRASRPRPDLVRHLDRGGGGDRADQPAGRHEPVRHQCAVAPGADTHGVSRRAAIHGRGRCEARHSRGLSDHLAVAAQPDAVIHFRSRRGDLIEARSLRPKFPAP